MGLLPSNPMIRVQIPLNSSIKLGKNVMKRATIIKKAGNGPLENQGWKYMPCWFDGSCTC